MDMYSTHIKHTLISIKTFSINNIRFSYAIVAILLFISSCQISENEIEPEATFNRIYNDKNFQGNYDPLDIKQTKDGGFVVLSSREKWSITILKTNQYGEVEKITDVVSPFSNALPTLMEIDSSYYFFCMNELSLNTYLMKINTDTWEPEIVKTYNDIVYPLAASQVPEKAILVQSYNRDSRSTQLAKLDAQFNISWKTTYAILEDKEEPIISHLTRIGKRLPFFTGYMGEATKASEYYINGFYNFSFSMLFVNTQSGEIKGVVNGFQDKGAISAASALSGNNMAFSRYSFGDNFILPRHTINANTNHFSGDLKGTQLPELASNANVLIKKIMVGGKEVIMYASETKSNQIVLLTYDVNSGSLLGTRYWGHQYPYKMASFTPTADGGLAIVGKTYIAGKFPRIYIIKLSAKELSALAL